MKDAIEHRKPVIKNGDELDATCKHCRRLYSPTAGVVSGIKAQMNRRHRRVVRQLIRGVRDMKAIIAIIIGATLGASAARATPPRVIRFNHGHQFQVQPVLAVQYVQSALATLPAYSVGMQQQLADPAVLERIAAALERIANRGNGELGELPPEPEYVGLVRQNCAKCHGVNPQGGTKYSMFHPDGRFREPTPEQLGEMINRLSTKDANKRMPPGVAMSADDRLALIGGLTSSPPEAAAKMPPGK